MKTCLTLLCLCLSLSFTAQNETIYWYFGNRAAINFYKGKLEVLGNSSYEFSLNNVDFFGNANNYFFSSVDTGLQTIYARDTNTCEQSIQINLSVIGFKKYFTPNGDGENDFWNVKGLDKTSFKSIDVQIFDRFGELIYSITNFDTLGWNDSYNGKNLNANNFWFKAKILDKDDNEIKESGNFSLIRD